MGGFPIFLGCRPFFAENCPLDNFPGATNPQFPSADCFLPEQLQLFSAFQMI